MMKTEKVALGAGNIATLSVSGKWFRVRKLVGGTDPYVTVKALNTEGNKQLADGLAAYDGDKFGWDDQFFRDLTFTNPTATAVTFDVLISDQGQHDVSRPAVAVVGEISVKRACGISTGNDEVVNAGATNALSTLGVVGDNTYKVIVQADSGNPGPVRVGGNTTGAANGFVLDPGASLPLEVTDSLGVLVLKCHNPNATPATVRVLALDRGPS